jgi:hypothetical protein
LRSSGPITDARTFEPSSVRFRETAQKHTQQQQQLQQRQQAAPHQAAPKPADKEKPGA